MSARQRTLATPEIVSLVLSWIYQDDQFHQTVYKESSLPDEDPDESYYGHLGVLLRCAQVNKLWHLEAVTFLWREPCIYTDHWLHTRFSAFTDFERKQYHANLVEETTLITLSRSEAARGDAVLEGVEFPRLKEVRIYLDGNGEHITKIRGSHVKVLDLDPSFDYYPDTYRVSREEMDVILDQLPVSIFRQTSPWLPANGLITQACFPNVEEVSFIDRCLAFPGALERFQAKLPHLKVLDKQMVDIGTLEAWEMPSTS